MPKSAEILHRSTVTVTVKAFTNVTVKAFAIVPYREGLTQCILYLLHHL